MPPGLGEEARNQAAFWKYPHFFELSDQFLFQCEKAHDRGGFLGRVLIKRECQQTRMPALAAQRILKSVIALPLTHSAPQPQRQHHGRACISTSYSVPRRNIFLLISVVYHRRYGRAVWIDPVGLRAITISWNNIIIPVRSCLYHGHPDDLPWLTNDFGLLRMRCGTERPQVTQHQGRSDSYGHYLHASASLPQRQINEHRS